MNTKPKPWYKSSIIPAKQSPYRLFPRIAAKGIVLFTISLAGYALAQASWHEMLSYGGGGSWPLRIPIEIENAGPAAIAGIPIGITINSTDSTSVLIGMPVASLRAAMTNGPELIFDLQDSAGNSKRSGNLAENDVIYLPVEAGPGDRVTIHVYAENGHAWLPPEWLRAALTNLGFEHGALSPEGWLTLDTDSAHRMSLDREVFRSGNVSARCDVDSGANPTWVKYCQGDLPVIPGQKYRFTGWVKGQNVRGKVCP